MYFWESHNFHSLYAGCRMPVAKARALSRSMCRYFKLRRFPTVKTWKGGKYGVMAEQRGPLIRVNTDRVHWTPALLAHEVAHFICDAKAVKGQDHGPVWMAVYLKLMDKFKILPLIVTLPLAKAYGLKVKDPNQCF